METEEGGCVIQILNNQFSTVGTAEIVLSFLYNNKFSDVGSFVAELPNTQNYNISDGTFLNSTMNILLLDIFHITVSVTHSKDMI